MNKNYIIYIIAIAVISYFIYTYVNKKPESEAPAAPENKTNFPTWETNKLYTPNTIVWWNNLLYKPLFLIGQSQTNQSPNNDGRWQLVNETGTTIESGPAPVVVNAEGNLTQETVNNIDWDSLLNSNSATRATIPTVVTNTTIYPTWTNKEWIGGVTVFFNGILYRSLMLIGGNNNNTPDKDGRWVKL
jgi:hypothetical protein